MAPRPPARSQPPKRLDNFGGVCGGIHPGPDPPDLACLINEEGHPGRESGPQHSVGPGKVVLSVAEHGKGKAVPFRECLLVLHRVQAGSDDLCVQSPDLLDGVAEPASLDGSAGSVRFWEEEKNDVLPPPELIQRQDGPVVGGDGEGRRDASLLRHDLTHCLSSQDHAGSTQEHPSKPHQGADDTGQRSIS